MSKAYKEEKARLNEIAKQFLSDNGDLVYTNEDADNVVNLSYCGDDVPTKVNYMELTDSGVVVCTSAEVYPNEDEVDMLTDFSNAEIRAILTLFGIQY